MNKTQSPQTPKLVSDQYEKPFPIAEKERLLKMMKAIGHPMRFEIMQFLLANPHCYTKEIVDALPISQATVSQHIKQLREAGWLASEAVCQMTHHWIDDVNVAWFKQAVGDMF